MTRQIIIERTLKAISNLPDEKAQEISDFAEFVCKRHEELELTKGIQQMMASSDSFRFLEVEEDVYTLSDLKEVYNAKG